MRLTALLLTVAFLQVQATTSGQTVTLTGKDLTLKEIFTAIKAQTGYMVFGKQELLDSGKLVSITARNMALTEFLDQVMKDQPLIYKISGKSIALSVKPFESVEFFPSARDVPITIKGKITDSTGTPIQGASIRLTPGNKGAFSGVDGTFVIANVAPGSYTLEISYVGFETAKRKITVAENSSFDIILQGSSSYLDEVVINKGYYTEKQRLSTGSVSKITSKEIQNQPLSSPLLALQGRVPGLELNLDRGAPAGIAPKIRIRGNNSLSDGGIPLFVVDGVIIDSRPLQSQSGLYYNAIDPLAGINPENIESIEVLKDADATSIYGSRGANGVILIKTKMRKGNAPLDIEINAYHGIQKMPRFMKMLNTEQYLEMRKDTYKNAGRTPPTSAYDLTRWDSTKYTNWQKELLGGSAKTNDVELSVAGGSERTSFRMNGGYYKETNIVSNDFGYQRGTVGVSSNHRSADQRLMISSAINYGVTKNDILNASGFLEKALQMAPNTPDLYLEDGSLNWGLYGTTYTFDNPMAELQRTNVVNTGTLVANATLSYMITRELSIKTSMGYTDVNGDELIKEPILARRPDGTGPGATASALFGTNKRRTWQIEPQATYDFNINDHQFNFLIGATFQNMEYQWQAVSANGYTSDVLLNTLKGATSYSYPYDDKLQYRYNAGFVRLGYNWKQKYLINLTGRRDGSSRFGPGKQFGNFGAVGAAWIFSSEKFMQNASNILSFGKLRGSYGTTGNDQISDYKFYNLYQIEESGYENTTVLLPKGLFNSEFNWEVTKKIELALELSFLKDRIFFQTNWYRNSSSNQIVDYRLPATTGFSTISRNFNATVENTGWEFLLVSQNFNSGNFGWTTSFNISLPKNRLVAFPGIEGTYYSSKYKIDEPLSIQYLYVWKGVDPQTGQHVLEDKDSNGYFDDNDKAFGYSRDAKYYGGLLNEFRHRGFEISFLFQFAKRIGSTPYTNHPGRLRENQPVEVLQRWQKPGDITDIPQFNYNMSVPFFDLANSNYKVVDASFIRLKTSSVSYGFSSELLKKIKIKQAKIFLQGQNLFVISNFIGLDPETGARSLPQLRSIAGGINLKF